MSSGLTVKQDALITALASGKAKTQRQAAKMAGMTEQHASTVLQNRKLQEALSTKQDRQADKVARMVARSGAVVMDALDAKHCEHCGQERVDPLFALSVFKVGKDIQREGGETEEGFTPIEVAHATLLVLHAVALGVRIGSRFGVKRGSTVLGSQLEALSLDQEQAAKVYAARTVKQLVKLARGE